MNDSAPDPFVVCDEHEYYNAIDPCPWCRIAALEQELHDCRLTDAPERTLMGLPISERIWEWWLDDWTGSDREIVLGFCAEVAALEQELEASRFAKRTWREQAELQSARIAALEQELDEWREKHDKAIRRACNTFRERVGVLDAAHRGGEQMKHTLIVIAVVLGLMFLLYTVPRWIWGSGLDLFPVLP